MSKVIIIGGGAAGMMAAIAASKNHEVYLIEKNEKLGKKVYITGKGRCNVTNAKDIGEFFDYIPSNPHFLYSAFYTYSNIDVMNFFENKGVKLKVERGDRVFPESDKSSDIIRALEKELRDNNVNILLNTNVTKLISNNNEIEAVELDNDKVMKADFFVVTTGGMSYPTTGSTGDGYKFAKKVGHSIIDPKGALVPLQCKDAWINGVQGLSLKNVELKIMDGKKEIFKDFGEMLFTHFGISGPLVLSASSAVGSSNNISNLKARVNLKPALTEKELDLRIQNDFKKYLNKNFSNALNDLLPKKLIDVIIDLSEIDKDKKVNSITKEERKSLVNLLQNITINIESLRPIKDAIITAGGIDTLEVDPSTMKSKLIDNLYFAGEVLDLDAYTGGYNLQIAFSTGYLAGMKIGE